MHDSSFEKICQFPKIGKEEFLIFRKYVIQEFPYLIYYQIDDETIWILRFIIPSGNQYMKTIWTTRNYNVRSYHPLSSHILIIYGFNQKPDKFVYQQERKIVVANAIAWNW